VLAILAAILGLAVAYFTQGADAVSMVIGVALGAAIGYLVGRSMDKAIEKEK
jgi:tetrahydromethanopterin S-methyltransferase subunit C